jgi:exonuclease VII small subunit
LKRLSCWYAEKQSKYRNSARGLEVTSMSQAPHHPEEDPSFDQQLQELEQVFHELKVRYAQVQHAEASQVELKERLEQIQTSTPQQQTQELKTELKQILKQLEDLELELESRLITWSSFKEPFWQAVRFGGLGVVIGWLLKSWAG